MKIFKKSAKKALDLQGNNIAAATFLLQFNHFFSVIM